MSSNFNCSYMTMSKLTYMRVELSDTILKWDYPRTIPARFGLIWFSGFMNGEKWDCPLQTVICYIEVPFRSVLCFIPVSKTRIYWIWYLPTMYVCYLFILHAFYLSIPHNVIGLWLKWVKLMHFRVYWTNK
jgi:hypothetical protein